MIPESLVCVFFMKNDHVKCRKVGHFDADYLRKYCAFRFAESSLEFLKIHTSFTPLLYM
jgi:hypothetical protein